MPLAKLRQDYVPLPPAPPAARLAAAEPNTVRSPALSLQQQLERQVAEAAGPALDRWSARRSLAFIVAAAAALWMAILMAGAEAVRMVA